MCSLRITSIACPSRALVGDVGDQRELARALDRRLQLPLMQRARPRDAARLDLAALRQERRQQADVLVIDVVDLLRAELADTTAAEEPAARPIAALALVVAPLRPAAAAASTFVAHRCTSYLSPRSKRSPRSYRSPRSSS